MNGVYLLPYTPQVGHQCQNSTEYYDSTIQKCCRLCPPGHRLFQGCTDNANTQCQACEEGTYTKSWSRGDRCFSCSAECRNGFVERKRCTQTQNRLCWCPFDEFCTMKISETCLICQPYQRCKRGYGTAVPGTEDRDVACAPCAPGTFSDVESHNATCRPHRVCQSQRTPGNRTHDAVCHDSVIVGGSSPPPSTVPARSRLPPLTSLTTCSMADTKESQGNLSTNISHVAGLLAGVTLLLLMVGATLCIVFRRKAQRDNEKKAFSPIEKALDNWPQGPSALGQEEQNLLQISTSSRASLESPLGSEESSGIISNISTVEEDDTANLAIQTEPGSLLNNCSHYSVTSSKQAGSGHTHVNVSCIVSVCNADHNVESLNSPVIRVSADGALMEEDLPLSKEESPVKRETKRQTAVEVEDNMEVFACDEKKVLPLSIQDVGMKIR
ncbi:tumor necrosis factor receptor superfamily member 1B isoform X2 [Hemicordylus capensis]|uniref:tumor necrosis factor receptor superfamily member 1B isoform X2 n=1 Tax=Hemicordylus capensis TaxID=884348 RepID=UPI002302A110|nr:tumor necrosis factor receptor superfamily member 1B isoform X2 [Hemicordylus capensis]